MSEVTVIAKLKLKKGMEENGKKEFLRLVPKSRQDKGCLQYDLHQGLEDKRCFMFYERWESGAALDAHRDQPFVKDFFQNIADLLDGPAEVALWNDIYRTEHL